MKNYHTASNSFSLAKAIYLEHFGTKHISYASTLPLIARIEMYLLNTFVAQKYYDEALTIYKELFGDNHIEIAKILVELGELNVVFEKMKVAQQYYEQALEIFEKYDAQVEIAACYSQLGNMYGVFKNYEMAIKYFTMSKEIFIQCYSQDHPYIQIMDGRIAELKLGNYIPFISMSKGEGKSYVNDDMIHITSGYTSKEASQCQIL